MKVTYKTLSGIVNSKEFESPEDFVRLQNLEVPAIEDSNVVVTLEIDGKIQDFKGNILDLYNYLNQK